LKNYFRVNVPLVLNNFNPAEVTNDTILHQIIYIPFVLIFMCSTLISSTLKKEFIKTIAHFIFKKINPFMQ